MSVLALHPETEWPALYSTQRKRNANPHEFTRLITARAYCRSAIAPPRGDRSSITDIWDISGKRHASLLRRLETGDGTVGISAIAQVNATEHLYVLGQCQVHPIIELDFVGAPDLHRYPHLRKFCSMIDFDMISPQRVVAFYTTVRLFPDRWKEIIHYNFRSRTLLGATRYNQMFKWPSSAELLEIAEAYREYFRPSSAVAAKLVESYRSVMETVQISACQVFLTESKNDGFRLVMFLCAVLRPCVGKNTAILDRLFDYIGELKLSCRKANRDLLDAVKKLNSNVDIDEIGALLAEFRLPRRKHSLLYPKRAIVND
jgi:hypothetical protein